MAGRDYLKKIIQLPFDLPELPSQRFRGQTIATIKDVVKSAEYSGSLENAITGTGARDRIVQPLIRNMRDLRQYAAAIRGTLASVGGKVALVDVLALEAVRIFLPDVFMRFPGSIGALTLAPRELESRIERGIEEDGQSPLAGVGSWVKEEIDELLKAAAEDKEIVEAVIDTLFPAASRIRRTSEGESEAEVSDAWMHRDDEETQEQLKARRVAHDQVFRYYLERVASRDLLAFHEAERIFVQMANRNSLERVMHMLDATEQGSVISHLKYFEDQFEPMHVEPSVIVLFNLLPRMPAPIEKDFDNVRGDISNLTVLLLKRLEDSVEMEGTVRRILSELTSLSCKTDLILLVGYNQDRGHKLLAESSAFQLEEKLREEIRSVSAEDLVNEYDLKQVLSFVIQRAVARETLFEIPWDDRVTFSVLWSIYNQSLGNSKSLDWKLLVELYGGKGKLKTRIGKLDSAFSDLGPWVESRNIALYEAESLRALAVKHVSGWESGSEP